MTCNTRNGDIYVANEKGPAMIVRCHKNGVEYESNIITYARDISGLAYDDVLDLLWVLSDQNEQFVSYFLYFIFSFHFLIFFVEFF